IVNNINVAKNKKYNHLNLLTNLAKLEGKMSEVINDPRIIDYYVANGCNFYIDEADVQKIHNVFKMMNENRTKLLSNYSYEKTYDGYCNLINDIFIEPTNMYKDKKNYSFFEYPKETSNVSKLKYFSYINSKPLLQEFRKI